MDKRRAGSLQAGWRGQQDLCGPFEQLVLLALVRSGRNAPASHLRGVLEVLTGREIAVATVGTTLARMETKGFVSSWLRPPVGPWWMVDRRPGGGVRNTRRLWSLEELGRRALRRTLDAIDRTRAGLRGLDLGDRLFTWLNARRTSRVPARESRSRLRAERVRDRRSRQAARRLRTRLMGLLRACGFEADERGVQRRLRPRQDEDAALALRRDWNIWT